MTPEEIEDLANQIGHDVVEAPDDQVGEAEAEEAIRLASISASAAARVLADGGSEAEAIAEATESVEKARRS